jgi:hypothetical protein
MPGYQCLCSLCVESDPHPKVTLNGLQLIRSGEMKKSAPLTK